MRRYAYKTIEEVGMAWNTVPVVKVQYLRDEEGKELGVLISIKDFNKLTEKIEDFLDIQAIEKAKKVRGRLYSHAEIKEIIENKKK